MPTTSWRQWVQYWKAIPARYQDILDEHLALLEEEGEFYDLSIENDKYYAMAEFLRRCAITEEEEWQLRAQIGPNI